jgi:hypothetical protein
MKLPLFAPSWNNAWNGMYAKPLSGGPTAFKIALHVCERTSVLRTDSGLFDHSSAFPLLSRRKADSLAAFPGSVCSITTQESHFGTPSWRTSQNQPSASFELIAVHGLSGRADCLLGALSIVA